MRHTWVRAISGAALVVGVVVVFLLWPTTLGGSTSYVTTHGVSMQPFIRQGDLVLVRHASTFDVGDVVAYRSEALHGTTVLHRIIGRDGARYVFKGDNNNFVDDEHPTQAQLIGKLWLHVPHGGVLTSGLRTALPWLVGAGGLLSAAGTTHRSRKRRRKPVHLAPRAASLSSTRSWRTAAIASGACAVGCIGVGVLAFGQPASRTGAEVVRYAQTAAFTYGAPTTAGPVYPSGRVQSGDPVFLRLVDALDFGIDYGFQSGAAHNLHGAVAVKAVVSDSTGWSRAVPLTPPVTFTGDTAHTTAHLDLAQVQRLLGEVQATTGVKATSAKVTLVPMARITGTLGEQTIDQTYEPHLDFSIDQLQLQVTSDKTKDPLHLTDEASLSHPTSSPTSLAVPVVGVKVPVKTARTLAVLLGLPSIVAAAGAGLVLGKRLKGEVARIELRHGHRIVPVVGSPTSTHVVELTSMEDLARLAEQLGNLILHRETSKGHDYLLQADGGMVYRYTAEDHVEPSAKRAFEL